MTAKNFLFTYESVTEGHPDEICDQIIKEKWSAGLELKNLPAVKIN